MTLCAAFDLMPGRDEHALRHGVTMADPHAGLRLARADADGFLATGSFNRADHLSVGIPGEA